MDRNKLDHSDLRRMMKFVCDTKFNPVVFDVRYMILTALHDCGEISTEEFDRFSLSLAEQNVKIAKHCQNVIDKYNEKSL